MNGKNYSSKISGVLIMLSIVLQLNNLGLSKGSSVSAEKIRFVRIRTIHSGQWTRLSCIMEPVKRFSRCQEMHFVKAPPHHQHHLSLPHFRLPLLHLFTVASSDPFTTTLSLFLAVVTSSCEASTCPALTLR